MMGVPPLQQFQWTDERVALLKRLCAERLSYGEMAAELGNGVSRNACIGKAKRLGITNGRAKFIHSAPVDRKPRPSTRRVRRIVLGGERYSNLHVVDFAEPQMTDNNLSADDIPVGQRKTILELKEGDCRWPYGNPGSADFFFCGGTALPCLPYCPMHARIAYARPGKVISDAEYQRRAIAARRRTATKLRNAQANA